MQTLKNAVATALDVVRIVPDTVTAIVRSLDDGLHTVENVVLELVSGVVLVLSGLIHAVENAVLAVTEAVSIFLEDASDRLRDDDF